MANLSEWLNQMKKKNCKTKKQPSEASQPSLDDKIACNYTDNDKSHALNRPEDDRHIEVDMKSAETGHRALKSKAAQCVGVQCKHAGYILNDRRVKMLWRAHIGAAVVDLQRCPFGKWMKDKNGFPLNSSDNAALSARI